MIRLLVPVLFFLLVFITGCKKEEKPKVRVILEDDRVINLELYRDIAPKSVDNFLELVDQDFYAGIVFHRIIKDFMVQAGGYYLEGNNLQIKEPQKTIEGEFASNGFENNLKHTLGVISMARTSDPNSASSQFFICTATSPHLDGEYAAFGKTIDEASNQVLLELNEATTSAIHPTLTDFPIPTITIKTIERIK